MRHNGGSVKRDPPYRSLNFGLPGKVETILPFTRTATDSRRVMSNYRRARMPGGTYFFTVNLRDRSSDLLVREIHLLRQTVAW